jgi:hypothetical protein
MEARIAVRFHSQAGRGKILIGILFIPPYEKRRRRLAYRNKR